MVTSVMMRGDVYGFDVPSTSAIRRAMRSLERKRWVVPRWVPSSVRYLRVPATDEERLRASELEWVNFPAVGDSEQVDPITGRRLSFRTERKVLGVTFEHGAPHPQIEERLTPYFRKHFEQALEDRRAALGERFRPPAVAFKQSLLWRNRQRDALLWADAMGSTLALEWAYFRWEAGRGGL
ncbi:hypothetical protein GCM10023258_39900 [Terrabacter aeriphilus]|uniref:Uncharacterized protein n=1 Tax=Terrabacter aeriphilus TaxID=515662 RepID=A0ABP9JMP5_9MICO